jgi:transposase
MLLQDPNLKVWLYTQPTDMRKQFDGLATLAKNKMDGQVNHGHLFVFINRRRTHMKALYYCQGGLCLWSKRLEQGRFHDVKTADDHPHKAGLSWAQLQCLIDGINWQKIVKNKRFIR